MYKHIPYVAFKQIVYYCFTAWFYPLAIHFFFWPCCAACRILVPRPGIEPGPTAVEARSPNHWTDGEFPPQFLITGCAHCGKWGRLCTSQPWALRQLSFSGPRFSPCVHRWGQQDPPNRAVVSHLAWCLAHNKCLLNTS